VLDCKLASKLRVFVLERVETVRALGNDTVEFDLAHGFQILLSEDLKQIFITHPAGCFTTTGFVKTQNSKINISFLKQVDEGSSDFLIAIVKS
jgi:hypothetical protein